MSGGDGGGGDRGSGEPTIDRSIDANKIAEFPLAGRAVNQVLWSYRPHCNYEVSLHFCRSLTGCEGLHKVTSLSLSGSTGHADASPIGGWRGGQEELLFGFRRSLIAE